MFRFATLLLPTCGMPADNSSLPNLWVVLHLYPPVYSLVILDHTQMTATTARRMPDAPAVATTAFKPPRANGRLRLTSPNFLESLEDSIVVARAFASILTTRPSFAAQPDPDSVAAVVTGAVLSTVGPRQPSPRAPESGTGSGNVGSPASMDATILVSPWRFGEGAAASSRVLGGFGGAFDLVGTGGFILDLLRPDRTVARGAGAEDREEDADLIDAFRVSRCLEAVLTVFSPWPIVAISPSMPSKATDRSPAEMRGYAEQILVAML